MHYTLVATALGENWTKCHEHQLGGVPYPETEVLLEICRFY